MPGSGQPILLLADHQTTGGYPKIATVISADLSVVGRRRPGDLIRFLAVSVAEEFFAKATQPWPPAKQQLTIRLDTDIVRWLKAHGRGYQTRINRILRAAMESTKSEPDREDAPPAP